MKPTKNSTKEFYFMRCSLLRHLLREGELKGYVVIFFGGKATRQSSGRIRPVVCLQRIMFDSISQLTVNQLKTGGLSYFCHMSEASPEGTVKRRTSWFSSSLNVSESPPVTFTSGRSSSSNLLTMLLAVIFAQQMKSAVG